MLAMRSGPERAISKGWRRERKRSDEHEGRGGMEEATHISPLEGLKGGM